MHQSCFTRLGQLVILSAILALTGGTRGQTATPDRLDWHCETLGSPRILVIEDDGQRGGGEAWAYQLGATLNAEVDYTLAEVTVRDDLLAHHLGDKPLEEPEAMRQKMVDALHAHRDRLLAQIDTYDVVIARMPRWTRNDERVAVRTRLAAYVRGGGKLIYVAPPQPIVVPEGSENPEADAKTSGPLADLLPIRAHHQWRAWTSGSRGATDHPMTRGIPFEITGFHTWNHSAVPIDEHSVELTRSSPRQLSFWYRPDASGGKVVQLFGIGGHRATWTLPSHYTHYSPLRPDDSAVWPHFMRRVVYQLAYGDEAFPVLARVDVPAEGDAEGDRDPAGRLATVRAGETLHASVDLENRLEAPRRVMLQVVLRDRFAGAAVQRDVDVQLAGGERRAVAVELPVDLAGVDPHLELRATVHDAATGRVLAEASRWLDYAHAAPVTVALAQPAARTGEAIEAQVTADASAPPGDYTLRGYLVDHRGRVLQSVHRPVRIAADAPTVGEGDGDADGEAEPAAIPLDTLRFEMPPGGSEWLANYWVVAQLVRDGQTLSTSRAMVQRNDPWDTRNKLEFSVWTHGGNTEFIELITDPGFNAFGMRGMPSLADRHGLRMYREGTGIDTFSVEIKHDNWDDTRTEMTDWIHHLNEKFGPGDRSVSLVSLGEESGFKGGWGRRYYWEGDEAPEIPQRVFAQYLRELYDGDIAALNEQWGTDYASFDVIPLARERVRWPGTIYVGAQAWEALQRRRPERLEGKEKVDLTHIDPAQPYLVRSAPYYETYRFFDWYYEKYCDLATEVWRAHRNPVPRTIMSAPGGFYPKVDVFNFAGQGAFYPKERSLARNARARCEYGDHLGFSGAMWAYFDLHTLWSCVIHSTLLVGNGHMDYWVDIPLTFNGDHTHTRASFWTRQLRRQLHAIEPILLHRRFSYTPGLAMYVPPQPLPKGLGDHFDAAIGPNGPVYSAREKSGYMPRVVNTDELAGDDVKVLVASYAQVVSPEEGRHIADFVRGGGLLIATPWLAACTPHGNMLTTYPSEASGLSDVLGFRLLNTSQARAERTATVRLEGLPVSELTLRSEGRDTVIDLQDDVQVLARYDDGEPLVLARRVGEGRVVYLNMVYDWRHWWNSFYEPGREAYRQLVDALLREDGRVSPRYGIAFRSHEETDLNAGWWGMRIAGGIPAPGEAVPWRASQTFASPDGSVRYLAVFADHRSPIITADVRWHDPDAQAFDLYAGEAIAPSDGAEPGVYRLTLEPGGAALWAFATQRANEVSVEAPATVRGAQPVPVQVTLAGIDKADVVHGVVLDVIGPDGTRSEAHSVRNGQVTGGRGTLTVAFAANDPAGTYCVIATDSLTRRRAEATIDYTPTDDVPAAEALLPFPPRAEDVRAVRVMTGEQFLDHLRRLREIYLGTHEGMEAKYRLSYYLNSPGRDDTRHGLMRHLQRTPWQSHVEAVAEAMSAGERFILMGEDLNVDPATGGRIDPFAVGDASAMLDALAALPGAQRSSRTIDGIRMDVIRLGNGALLVADTSVDRQAYTSAQFRAWHDRVRPALMAALDGSPN